MSTIPSSSTTTDQPHVFSQVDGALADAIDAASQYTVDPLGHAIKGGIEAITPSGEPIKWTYHNDTPSMLQLAIYPFANWHKNVLINSNHYAGKVEWAVEKVIKWSLFPLTFSQIGVSIQTLIAEKIIGRLVFVVTYCALQIFHIIPYITSSALITGTLFLYHTAPVALITMLAGSILILNLYFLYRANRGIDDTNQTLTRELGEGKKVLTEGLDTAINELKEAQKTLDAGLLTVKVLLVLGIIGFNWRDINTYVYPVAKEWAQQYWLKA